MVIVAGVTTTKYNLRSISQKTNNNKVNTNKMVQSLQKQNIILKRQVKTQKRTDNTPVASIPIQNRFSSFQDNNMSWNDDNDENTHRNQNFSRNVKVDTKRNEMPKPPPIKITDDNIKATGIKKLMNEAQITSFQAKSMSIGFKVDLNTKADYDKFINHLTATNVAFFTHSDRSKKTFKAVLSGLSRINTGIIIEEMSHFNITPSSVTELTAKNVNPDRCLYLVQFDNKDVSMNQLRNVRAIDHVVVNWKPYKPRNKGPTQCNKCAMLGHGAQNCHRSMACLICASTAHVADDCNFDESKKESFVFRCYNCVVNKLPNANHRANDPRCPCRSNYLEIRNKLNHKNAVRNDRANRISKDFNVNQADFPNLNNNAGQSAYNPTKKAGPTYAEQTKRQIDRDDLYSMDELFEILQSAIEDLSLCKSKGEQVRVLFKILTNAYE